MDIKSEKRAHGSEYMAPSNLEVTENTIRIKTSSWDH